MKADSVRNLLAEKPTLDLPGRLKYWVAFVDEADLAGRQAQQADPRRVDRADARPGFSRPIAPMPTSPRTHAA